MKTFSKWVQVREANARFAPTPDPAVDEFEQKAQQAAAQKLGVTPELKQLWQKSPKFAKDFSNIVTRYGLKQMQSPQQSIAAQPAGTVRMQQATEPTTTVQPAVSQAANTLAQPGTTIPSRRVQGSARRSATVQS